MKKVSKRDSKAVKAAKQEIKFVKDLVGMLSVFFDDVFLENVAIDLSDLQKETALSSIENLQELLLVCQKNLESHLDDAGGSK